MMVVPQSKVMSWTNVSVVLISGSPVATLFLN